MFTTVRRALTGFAVLASAVGAFTVTAPAANAAPDLASTFFGGSSDGTVVVALSSEVMGWPIANRVDAGTLCDYDQSVKVGLEPQINRFRSIDVNECIYLLQKCAVPAQDAGRNAGITMWTGADGVRHHHCWSYSSSVSSMEWHQQPAPALMSPSNSDARWLVFDRDNPSAGVLSKPSIALSNNTSARVTGPWFVTSSADDGWRTESQSQLLTYVDWSGVERTAWAQPTRDGGYHLVSFQTSQGIFNGGRVLQPEYCVASILCRLTNAIQFIGADGHHYTAGLEASLKVGAPTHSANPTIDTPITFDAADFAPARSQGELTYQWRFQRSSVLKTYGSPVAGRTVAHQWSRVGTYAVELTVTDAIGRKAVTTMHVVLQ